MNAYCVMISFLLSLCVFGNVQQAFARSLLLPSDPNASFGTSLNRKQLMNNAEMYFDNQEQLLDVRLQNYDPKLLSNIEQLFVMVKTKTTRGKRYIQQHLTPCFFKICNMGRKRLAQNL